VFTLRKGFLGSRRAQEKPDPLPRSGPVRGSFSSELNSLYRRCDPQSQIAQGPKPGLPDKEGMLARQPTLDKQLAAARDISRHPKDASDYFQLTRYRIQNSE
jgi:hypothetical protein